MGAWVWWGYGRGNSSPRCCLLVSVALKRQTDPPWATAWVQQWAHAEQSTFTSAFSQQGLKSISPMVLLAFFRHGEETSLPLGQGDSGEPPPRWTLPQPRSSSLGCAITQRCFLHHKRSHSLSSVHALFILSNSALTRQQPFRHKTPFLASLLPYWMLVRSKMVFYLHKK